MRKPNGFGSVKKLSGNRRRPYVYVITRPDGKRQAIQYFENQTEAEIFQIEYVKQHYHRSLPGHRVTFAELFYRWLPTHIADIEPAQSTIDNYHNSFRHCSVLQEMPVAALKFKDYQAVIDRMKKERLSFSSLKKVRSMLSLKTLGMGSIHNANFDVLWTNNAKTLSVRVLSTETASTVEWAGFFVA